MTDIEQLKKRLADAGEIQDPLDRRLAALAVVTEALSTIGVRPVLVGGMAVEFYTGGGYATADIDAVAPYVPEVDAVMKSLEFVKEGRHWVNTDLEVFIEMLTPPVDGSPEKIVEMKFGELPIYIIGIEDLVMDRLRAFEHWRSKEDGRWAVRMLTLQSDRIDWNYLRRRVSDENLEEAFSRMTQPEEEE